MYIVIYVALPGSYNYSFNCVAMYTAPPDNTTSTLQATATLPSSSASKNQNELLKESK